MSKLSRVKGATFERAIATKLRPIWSDARRGIGQTRSASECADVEGTPFWVECKHRKRISVMAAWNQATAATDGRPVLVILKQDRGPLLVTMEFSEWSKLWT